MGASQEKRPLLACVRVLDELEEVLVLLLGEFEEVLRRLQLEKKPLLACVRMLDELENLELRRHCLLGVAGLCGARVRGWRPVPVRLKHTAIH